MKVFFDCNKHIASQQASAARLLAAFVACLGQAKKYVVKGRPQFHYGTPINWK